VTDLLGTEGASRHTSPGPDLRASFDAIDIYLFDQLLKGRLDGRPRVLDAGCGDGRNLRYLLSRGFTCHGVDRDPRAVEIVQRLAIEIASDGAMASGRFRVGELDRLPWADACMDAVICSAVLHFADDAAHFGRMMGELWRVLAPGGLLFTRLASNIGLEQAIGPGGRRVRLPDGSVRFVVDEAMLGDWTDRLGGRLADPIKTTVVQGMRAMTTWCLVRPPV
jgi:SAM-dependent methyltransferase